MKHFGLDQARRRLARGARTTAGAAFVVLVFAVASATAIAVSSDPAPVVIAFGALGVSALQYWRTEMRGPQVTVLVIDSPAVEIRSPEEGEEKQYAVAVRQPVVVENTGGRPCALAKFRIASELMRVSGWSEERMTIEGGLGETWGRPNPRILLPREPQLFTATWTFAAEAKPLDGTPLDLARRLKRAGLVKPVRHADLVYSESGTTITKSVRIALNEDVIREAASQLVVMSHGGEPGLTVHSPVVSQFERGQS